MTKPICIHKVPAAEFYTSGRAQCPRCHTSYVVEAPPMVIMASSVLPTGCPECGLSVIINMLAGDIVAFEGFDNSDDRVRRIIELGKQYDNRSKPKKPWWRFW